MVVEGWQNLKLLLLKTLKRTKTLPGLTVGNNPLGLDVLKP